MKGIKKFESKKGLMRCTGSGNNRSGLEKIFTFLMKFFRKLFLRGGEKISIQRSKMLNF